MELQGQHQADHALREERGGFSQGKAGIRWTIGKLVKPPRRPQDWARQRLRGDPMGGEVSCSQHGVAAKQIDCLFALANGHMNMTLPTRVKALT